VSIKAGINDCLFGLCVLFMCETEGPNRPINGMVEADRLLNVDIMLSTDVVVRQASISSWEQGIRWHLPVLPTTLARLALRAQARRKEKGCPSCPSAT
jgi:hypothetical protein